MGRQKPKSHDARSWFGQQVHFGYGTTWGAFHGLWGTIAIQTSYNGANGAAVILRWLLENTIT